jgi:hypothetical protein
MSLGGMLKKRNVTFLVDDAPQAKKVRSTPKAVRFAESDMVTTRSCTQDDLWRAWYNKEEYEAFKDDCRDDIRRFHDAQGDFQLFDHDRYCLRGLEEQITPDAYYALRERKVSFLRAILREQELHVKLGKNEPESFKAISILRSRESKEWALELGKFDSSCTFKREVSN